MPQIGRGPLQELAPKQFEPARETPRNDRFAATPLLPLPVDRPVCNGCPPCKGGALRWAQVPPGECSKRKGRPTLLASDLVKAADLQLERFEQGRAE